MVTVPRLVVAAPSSGAGKTTVAVGLMAALRTGGHRVAGFKVGPDYIDPGFHAVATGRPGRNLDPMLSGSDLVAPLFAHGSAGADIAVIEGVMGLFDGALGTSGFASTAHVARLLRAPVLLVVDASAAGRSVGATVTGFQAYDARIRLAGVILNKVGSDRHETEVRAGVEPSGIPVVGVLRRDASLAVPSRHLGLVPVAEQRDRAVAAVEAAADLVRKGVDLDAVLTAASSSPPLVTDPWSPAHSVRRVVPSCGRQPISGDTTVPLGGGKVAVAGGPVFSFRYTETVELLEAAGARVVEFDPLTDESLPEATSGLYLGGGFPEMHAEALSANVPLRRQVARLVEAGMPVVAECAGLLYLCHELDGYPMAGVIPATARMTEQLTLGYRTAIAATSSGLFDEGRRVHGHEFHRTTATYETKSAPAWHMQTGPEGIVTANVHASYLHLHWTGTPDVAFRFADAARRWAAR